MIKTKLASGKLHNVPEVSEHDINHNNIVKFHENNTTTQAYYTYTHTLYLVYNRKVVSCSNSVNV